MNKNIFIILTSCLLILVLIYLYNQTEQILNKEYNDYQNNIYIDYPYFNNPIIDTYITNYLNPYITNKPSSIDLLFIDYDYHQLNEKIELILYIYQEKENMIKQHSKKFEIEVNNNVIIENTKVLDTSIEYDILNQNIINPKQPMIALTFDDGPNHNTNRILDILEKYNVKATFFILGSNIKNNEDTIKRMFNMGMEIGNHMYSHKLLTKLTNEEILTEINYVDNAIYNITNTYPTLLRPSYGTINNRIKKLIDRPIIIWNIDTLDWKYHNSKKISNRIISSAKDGNIILMHDIYRATANSLEITIPKLLQEGYQLVTVSELLYYKGIPPKSGQVYSNT